MGYDEQGRHSSRHALQGNDGMAVEVNDTDLLGWTECSLTNKIGVGTVSFGL